MSYGYETSGYDTGYSTAAPSHTNGGGFVPNNDFTSSQLNNPYSQQGNNSSSNYASNDPTKTRGNFNLVPLTIKQFYSLTHTDERFRLPTSPPRDVNHIRLVAQVVDVKHTNAGNSIYTVNDGTGEVTCTLYVKDGADMSSRSVADIVVHQYVRVVGYPRASNNGQRSVSVVDVRAVSDMNEVTYHQIESAYTALKAAAPAASQQRTTATASVGATAGGGVSYGGVAVGGGGAQSAGGVYMSDGSSGGGGVVAGDVSGPAQAVLQAFMHHPSEQGADVHEVAERTGLSVMAVRKAVAELSEEGHLYSTIDEDHFKSTSE